MSTYYLRQNNYLGEKSQEILNKSKVAIIGLGGLGSAVAQILARMGVGNLVLFDKDKVQEHNLSRQQLYTTKDIGEQKVLASKKHLLEINPDIKIEVIEDFADESSLENNFPFDCIIDCTDRHESRRLIDSFTIKHNISWVHGGAIREQGVVCVFGPKSDLKSYEDIYKGKNEDEFCEGIIATTTSLIASLQASLTIKILLNLEIPSELFRINLDSWTFESLKLSKK